MNADADDLPLLTQVLRVGDGRPMPSPPAEVAQPHDETLEADQLVIGNEPRQVLQPYLSPASDAADEIGRPPLDLEALAARVEEAVLVDLRERIDPELDARIAQALHSEVEVALASLQSRLRDQLAVALGDVVRRVVDDHVSRLRPPPH